LSNIFSFGKNDRPSLASSTAAAIIALVYKQPFSQKKKKKINGEGKRV